MATYKGKREGWIKLVTKDGNVFGHAESLKVVNHSPDGFEWGYGGSGPAQLALALLLDVTGNAAVADRLHQAFKWEWVAKWGEEWSITTEEIKLWLAVNKVEA
jgi:hypothetical protein